MTGACWSTAICSESERRSLGLASDGEWLLTCRLSDGHAGDHATDASMRPRQDRRAWLMWDDRSVHRVTSRDACPMYSHAGAPCLLFIAHGGMHYYGAPAQPGLHSVPSGEIDASDVRMPTGPADGGHARSESTQSPSASARVTAREAEPAIQPGDRGARVAQPAAPAVAPAAHAADPVVERSADASGKLGVISVARGKRFSFKNSMASFCKSDVPLFAIMTGSKTIFEGR